MRVVEALNLQQAKAVVAPAVTESKNVDRESIRECPLESLRTLEKASKQDGLDADKTSLYRSAVTSGQAELLASTRNKRRTRQRSDEHRIRSDPGRATRRIIFSVLCSNDDETISEKLRSI